MSIWGYTLPSHFPVLLCLFVSSCLLSYVSSYERSLTPPSGNLLVMYSMNYGLGKLPRFLVMIIVLAQ